MESAFHNIRKCIANSCVLTIHLPEDAMSVATDASGLEIDGVLQVRRGQDWEAAAFSRQTRSVTLRQSWRHRPWSKQSSISDITFTERNF